MIPLEEFKLPGHTRYAVTMMISLLCFLWRVIQLHRPRVSEPWAWTRPPNFLVRPVWIPSGLCLEENIFGDVDRYILIPLLMILEVEITLWFMWGYHGFWIPHTST